MDPRYGWRCYTVDGNRLVSPWIGRIPLPRNGVLDGVYFMPLTIDIKRTANWCKWGSWVGGDFATTFALTFGRVHGPFEQDYGYVEPSITSMRCARYEALAIVCPVSPERFVGAYALPVVQGLDLTTLAAVERAFGQPAASPMAQVREAIKSQQRATMTACGVLAGRAP